MLFTKRSTFFAVFNYKMLAILLLGISSGLPLALCGATLQLWYYEDGIDIKSIALLGFVSQPYVLKFLWAPILDYLRPPVFSKRKGWIFIIQGILGVILLLMSKQSPGDGPLFMAFLAVCLCFFSASQDIVIDAYRVTILRSAELGLGVAWATTGYRFGMIIANSIALILADLYGFKFVYFFMALLMFSFMSLTVFLKEKENDIEIKRHRNILMPLQELISRSYGVRILLFIVCYKLGATLLEGMLSIFLREIGFSLSEIGFVGKTISLVSTIVGAFIGGILITKLKLYRSLLVFGLLQGSSMLLYVALAYVGNNYYLLIAAAVVEHVCGGTATAAYLALIMAICKKEFAATQLAVLTAISSIGRVYAAVISGFLIAQFGWAEFFMFCIVVSLSGVLLLIRLKKDILSIQQKNEEAIT